MENQSVRIAALSPSITTNILRMGQRAVQVQGLSLRCIVRHGTMFEGETCRLESGSMRFVCSSRARKISSCLLAKEIHVISYYWGESAQRLNRYYRRPECLWHLYMRITDTRLSRTAGISVDGLPLELDRGILESYQTRHKRHLLPCWRVIG